MTGRTMIRQMRDRRPTVRYQEIFRADKLRTSPTIFTQRGDSQVCKAFTHPTLRFVMLLSFAQFEREVIGERVRHKIAASRARGMWMGGPVPLGYRAENRKLLVDDAAAATVRHVFEGFADIGSATRLLPILRAEGLLTKHGRPFYKGVVYKLLVNRVYLGEAVHKGTSYPGEHAAIIPCQRRLKSDPLSG